MDDVVDVMFSTEWERGTFKGYSYSNYAVGRGKNRKVLSFCFVL
jgi:hypothetical protein